MCRHIKPSKASSNSYLRNPLSQKTPQSSITCLRWNEQACHLLFLTFNIISSPTLEYSIPRPCRTFPGLSYQQLWREPLQWLVSLLSLVPLQLINLYMAFTMSFQKHLSNDVSCCLKSPLGQSLHSLRTLPKPSRIWLQPHVSQLLSFWPPFSSGMQSFLSLASKTPHQ